MTGIIFPTNPATGQKFTALTGVVYEWDGLAWVISFYDSPTQQLTTVGDIMDQVRTLLQDTDLTSGQYRYSTDSIVTNLNQCMTDLFRMRPDLFLELSFQLPHFTVDDVTADTPFGIEEQYVSPIISYIVGLTQARDDEQTQDARAGIFLATFTKQVLTVS